MTERPAYNENPPILLSFIYHLLQVANNKHGRSQLQLSLPQIKGCVSVLWTTYLS